MAEQDSASGECRTCGNTVSAGEDGYAVCCGTRESGPHREVTVLRPCGVCGTPIRYYELCQDCADDRDGDAFTINWGTGSRPFSE